MTPVRSLRVRTSGSIASGYARAKSAVALTRCSERQILIHAPYTPYDLGSFRPRSSMRVRRRVGPSVMIPSTPRSIRCSMSAVVFTFHGTTGKPGVWVGDHLRGA